MGDSDLATSFRQNLGQCDKKEIVVLQIPGTSNVEDLQYKSLHDNTSVVRIQSEYSQICSPNFGIISQIQL